MTAFDLSSLDLLAQQRHAQALQGEAASRCWFAPWRAMPTPDGWQKSALLQLVTRQDDVLMLASRGAGKSEVTACAAYLEAAVGGFCCLLSRSDRQAMELLAKVTAYHKRLHLQRATRVNAHELWLANGGMVKALPCRHDTIRGNHGVTLLVIDEAAQVPDEFYGAVTPFVSTVGGRIALLSTPFGQRGFFYNEWRGKGRQGWRRHSYTWRNCPRLTPEFIEQERRSHGNDWIRQEYEVTFMARSGATFDAEAFEQLVGNDDGGYVW